MGKTPCLLWPWAKPQIPMLPRIFLKVAARCLFYASPNAAPACRSWRRHCHGESSKKAMCGCVLEMVHVYCEQAMETGSKALADISYLEQCERQHNVTSCMRRPVQDGCFSSMSILFTDTCISYDPPVSCWSPIAAMIICNWNPTHVGPCKYGPRCMHALL